MPERAEHEREGDQRTVRFAGAGLHGEVAAELDGPDLADRVARLVDPASAEQTLHWGRNYLYAARIVGREGAVDTVVKQFRNQGRRRALERRLRGSKAERSWRAAHALLAAGLDTPRPLVLAESDRPDGPSYLVTERLVDAHEVRHFFRRLVGAPSAGPFPQVEPNLLIAELGSLARRMHDAGIWFRDLSMGNVLVRVQPDGSRRFFLLDLNRVRTGRRLGTWRRIRDTCRFPLLETAHREAFLTGYWGRAPWRWSPRWWLWVASIRGYLAKHAVKSRLRRRRGTTGGRHGGMHHAHIPAAAEGAAARDKVVWDRLSDQPHQHASGLEKGLIRLADLPDHMAGLAAAAVAAPRIRAHYRRLLGARYRRPVELSGIGLAVRPWTDDPAAQLRAIDDLGVRRVLVRLHPWENDHDAEEDLARALAGRGLELTFALPQNRDLVREPALWRSAVERLAGRFAPYGRRFVVGQAVNRSKWGAWSQREILELGRAAAEVLRGRHGAEVLGPAVIDFEPHVTAALVNRRGAVRFDALASLLYVDRRGAPENRQLGFDAADKVTLLAAIAAAARGCADRSWITEFNWPLREGPHSPAGRTVAVDEERQADYLVRYFLLTLGTGLVERAFWWRLIARGYGLVAPAPDGSLRRRPSFVAMATLIRELEGATFLAPLPAPDGARLYRFRRGDGEVVVAWSREHPTMVELPRPALEVTYRDGERRPAPSAATVEAGPSPRYYRLTSS